MSDGHGAVSSGHGAVSSVLFSLINRGAWFHSLSSLGTSPLSHLIHHPPPP
ncbi:hypothetical protein Hdeb2414_s0012g00376861 [Helianthus debilis subsp. tardiflorus]